MRGPAGVASSTSTSTSASKKRAGSNDVTERNPQKVRCAQRRTDSWRSCLSSATLAIGRLRCSVTHGELASWQCTWQGRESLVRLESLAIGPQVPPSDTRPVD